MAECIMVVEEEEEVRKVLARVLASAGYEVSEADSGWAALELAEELPRVEMILTDIVMAGFNGRDLMEAIRRRHPHAAALYMAGYSQGETYQREEGSECDTYVDKAALAQTLVHRLQEIMPARNVPELIPG